MPDDRYTMALDDALAALPGEISRQDTKYPGTMPEKLLDAAIEELGEVARALNRNIPLDAPHGALHELDQLAAIAVRGRAALACRLTCPTCRSPHDETGAGNCGPAGRWP